MVKNDWLIYSESLAFRKNPECESVRDFYFLYLHYSLFTRPHIRNSWQVIRHSE